MTFVPEQLLAKNAFGGLAVTEEDPEVQINAQYNTPNGIRTIVIDTGTTDIVGGEYKASSGANVGGIAAIFSDRQLISRAGQGSLVRISARFPDVADFSLAGPATASDRMNFGYSDGVFGINQAFLGEVIVQVLTLTVAAGGAEIATVTVNGQPFAVPLTAGAIPHNCNEIAAFINSATTLYNLTQNGNTVVLRSVFAAPAAGAFTFSSDGTAIAAWVSLSDGVLPEEDFIPQANWNVDTRISTNPDINLVPASLNYYAFQYNGTIDYFVQDKKTGDDVLVHKHEYPNTSLRPMFSVASFRIAWSVRNLTNAVNADIFGSVGSGFTEGERQQTESSKSVDVAAASVTTTLINIISVRCREVFGTKVNLGRILPKMAFGTTESAKGAVIEICKGVTFGGDTNFSYRDEATSIAEIDVTPNTVTGGECIASIPVGLTNPAAFDLESIKEVILPGEIITLAMHLRAAPSADCTADLIWDEDV
jgi:hypothetical protein